jgi:hypothetical protein
MDSHFMEWNGMEYNNGKSYLGSSKNKKNKNNNNKNKIKKIF